MKEHQYIFNFLFNFRVRMKHGGDSMPLGMIHGVIKTLLELPVAPVGPGSAQTLPPGNGGVFFFFFFLLCD